MESHQLGQRVAKFSHSLFDPYLELQRASKESIAALASTLRDFIQDMSELITSHYAKHEKIVGLTQRAMLLEDVVRGAVFEIVYPRLYTMYLQAVRESIFFIGAYSAER
jgi:hypothetical protein